jgi:hypothetical protein
MGFGFIEIMAAKNNIGPQALHGGHFDRVGVLRLSTLAYASPLAFEKAHALCFNQVVH